MHFDLSCPAAPPAAPWLGEIGRTVGMDETGLVLGHGTCLVRLSQDGSLELESDRDRALALLSVAGRQTASPDALKKIEAAAADWRRGEKALANLRLVFAGLPGLDEPADA